MAPTMEVNLSSIQEQDLLMTYFMLYQYMAEEFVHKDDLQIILNSNVVTGACATPAGAGTIAGKAAFTPSDAIVRGKAAVYDGLVRSGKLAREGLLAGLNAITSSKTSF